ncbi:MAG: hypothetical protein CSB02_01180 [Bacteroidia bacterium]|nr:MAG: hypothetical protein CSB02_01180 [Bacteroidia bacterium]
MDRNSIIGIVLIFLIFVGFSYFNAPSEEEMAARQARLDSIAQVQREQRLADSIQTAQALALQNQDNTALNNQTAVANDSTREIAALKDKYGVFSLSAVPNAQDITVQSNQAIWKLQTLGGKLSSVELTQYKAYDSSKLILFEGDKNKFGMVFSAANRLINTEIISNCL